MWPFWPNAKPSIAPPSKPCPSAGEAVIPATGSPSAPSGSTPKNLPLPTSHPCHKPLENADNYLDKYRTRSRSWCCLRSPICGWCANERRCIRHECVRCLAKRREKALKGAKPGTKHLKNLVLTLPDFMRWSSGGVGCGGDGFADLP